MSKTKIGSRVTKKQNPSVVNTVLTAKKNEAWFKVAQIISGPRSNHKSLNLKDIENVTTEGDTVVVAGKVLGSGEISKKVRVCAMSFSKTAEEKLKAVKGEHVTILEEIKKNPKAEGVKLL